MKEHKFLPYLLSLSSLKMELLSKWRISLGRRKKDKVTPVLNKAWQITKTHIHANWRYFLKPRKHCYFMHTN